VHPSLHFWIIKVSCDKWGSLAIRQENARHFESSRFPIIVFQKQKQTVCVKECLEDMLEARRRDQGVEGCQVEWARITHCKILLCVKLVQELGEQL
jgi:hypothetical protein